MSKAYDLLASPENLEKVRSWGYQPTVIPKGMEATGCTQCSDCDRWVHDLRVQWSGGGGEEPEYDPHCLQCALVAIDEMIGYSNWIESEMNAGRYPS